MRRADLVVGQAYYMDASPRWEQFTHGHKAVVVDVRPHEKPERWRRQDGPQSVEKGNGVLVDLNRYGTVSRTVVPLGTLRGPYTETAARLGREQTEQARHRRKVEREREQARQRAEALVKRARDKGGNAHVSITSWGEPRIEVDLDTFERLLGFAAAFSLESTS